MGYEFQISREDVAISFWCRDFGDDEPVGTKNSLGVSFAEFCACFRQAHSTGFSAAGHVRIDRMIIDERPSYKFSFLNHWHGKTNHFTIDGAEWTNLLALIGLFNQI